MCEDAVEKCPWLLEHVPDWFLTQEQKDPWDDGLDKWYEGYKRLKAQKASIKDEVTPIAWHPSRWWNWCVSEDEKNETEKLFLKI